MELGKRKKNTNEPYHYKESNFDSINKAFDSFYKNIIPDDEWNNFKSILKTKLPTSFRITSISKVGDHVFGILTEKYIKNISEIDNLEWYPNKMAWQLNISKRELRKDENYNEFHKYLLNETSFGSISRQETVSMIPPILMDIQSHHLVLDMCASPGSKTAQILELISSSSDIPEGFVIANDMNINRCSTLVAQLKRISCPCQFITCEDARCFPTMLKTHPDGTTKYMQFDRILCDVPCSGDGTIRKNVDMYVKWKFQMAYDLHFVQRDILQRGLELLKVGGYLLYSTCSMNPVENEAVVYKVLKQYKNQIKCIDVSSKLKDLKYLPGVVDWNFINSQNLMYKRGLIEIPTTHEYVEYELKNCVRIHPHLQNTGGFFIALLYKESEIVNRNENAIETNPKKVNPNNKLKYKSSLKNYSRPLLDTDSDWSEITSFFELRNVKPSNLIIRSENDAKNTIYYINDQMVDFLSQNKSRIKIISCGSRIFGRSSFKRAISSCAFRVVQESVENVSSLFAKRIIPIDIIDFEALLVKSDVHTSEIKSFDQFEKNEQGAIIFLIHIEPSKSLHVVGHLGIYHVRLMINKVDRIHYLTLLGYDILRAMEMCEDVNKPNDE